MDLDHANKTADIPHYQRTIGLNTPNLAVQRKGNAQRFPSLQLLERGESNLKFIISDTDVSMVNALRRIMYAEVPTIALHSVEIVANSSCLTDEFLAHRLGLIPLTSSGVNYMNDYRRCDCQTNCVKCSVTFTLAQKNYDPEYLLVTTDDLKSSDPHCAPIRFEDPIVIAKLAQNQELSLKMIARKGIGQEHAKFCPVSVAVFQHEPFIKINDAAGVTEKAKKDIVASCPVHVFQYDASLKSLFVEFPENCMFCMECTKEATEVHGRPDWIQVGATPGRFIFEIETIGQLTPAEVLTSAFDVLLKKLAYVDASLPLLP